LIKSASLFIKFLEIAIPLALMQYLEKKGFGPVLTEDISAYTVKIDRFKKYGAILKKSIDYDEKGKDTIFVMKDLVSVEEAIAKGAERAM